MSTIDPWLKRAVDAANEHYTNKPNAVYVVVVNEELVKIGFSTCPESRLDQLRTACPYPIKIAAYLRGTRQLETELHRIFAKDRVRGEWFMWQPRIKLFVGNAVYKQIGISGRDYKSLFPEEEED